MRICDCQEGGRFDFHRHHTVGPPAEDLRAFDELNNNRCKSDSVGDGGTFLFSSGGDCL